MEHQQNKPGAMPENLSNVSDSQQTELAVETAESNLEKALKAERLERKALERKLKELASEKELREQADLESKGKYDEALAKFRADAQKKIADAENYALLSGLRQIAAAYIHPEVIDDVLTLKRVDFTLTDGRITASGYESPEAYFADLAKNKPVYARVAQAGIAVKGGNTRESSAEVLTRTAFDALTPAKRVEFIRRGGKLTD